MVGEPPSTPGQLWLKSWKDTLSNNHQFIITCSSCTDDTKNCNYFLHTSQLIVLAERQSSDDMMYCKCCSPCNSPSISFLIWYSKNKLVTNSVWSSCVNIPKTSLLYVEQISINLSTGHKICPPQNRAETKLSFLQNLNRVYNQDCKSSSASHSHLCHMNCRENLQKDHVK